LKISDIILSVFAIEQNDPAREWLTARTEVLVNHLRNCFRQPAEVRQKAQLQKDNTKSPKKSTSALRQHGPEASSSFQEPRHSISPYPRPPVLQVQTPLDSYQSAYTLAVPGPRTTTTHIAYEQEPSIVSTSTTSSLAPSDSISVIPPSRSRRRSRVASFTSPSQAASPNMAWSDARQMHFEDRIIRLTASAGLSLSWVENPEWLKLCAEFIPQAKSPSRKVLTQRLLPRTLSELQIQARQRVSGQNATASCDGWTGENFHHYIAFMIVVAKEVRHCSISTWITQRSDSDI
jgi:hypothetical protein